ncbi:MAG TPA: hypothetical protein VFI52_03280 [Gemmatimonadaceae bacterium]|nr:hypothetical protein [Gemmatimonadaceae bacterium]
MQIQSTPPAPAAPAIYGVANPTAEWQGAVAARRELNDQRNTLQGTRESVAAQLRNPMVEGVDRQGLEHQITDIDAQIATLDKAIAAANERVAATALVPGAVVEPPRLSDGPSERAYILGGFLMVIVFFPLIVARAVRSVRRPPTAMATLPPEMLERFARLDQAVDAMAVEIERIGEGQRFVTRLMSERSVSSLPQER